MVLITLIAFCVITFILVVWKLKFPLKGSLRVNSQDDNNEAAVKNQLIEVDRSYLKVAEELRWKDFNQQSLQISVEDESPPSCFSKILQLSPDSELFDAIERAMLQPPIYSWDFLGNTIYSYSIDPDRAFWLWQSLRKGLEGTQYLPFIMSYDSINEVIINMDLSSQIDSLIASSKTIEFENVFGNSSTIHNFAREDSVIRSSGFWGLSSVFDCSENSQCDENVYVLLAPVKSESEFLAMICFGRLLSGPSMAEHCFAISYLASEYGAEVIGVSDFTIDIYFNHPPKTSAGSIILASQLATYCENLLGNYDYSLDYLAECILNGEQIYLWWPYAEEIGEHFNN